MGGIPPSEPPRGCIPPPGRGVPWAQVLYPLPGRGWPKAQGSTVIIALEGGPEAPWPPLGGEIHSREASRGGKHPSVPPPVP